MSEPDQTAAMRESDETAAMRDPGLEALFRPTPAEHSDETFVAATMRRVEAAKAQRRLGRRLAEAAMLIAVVAASPWLIAASVRLSSLLDAGLAIVSGWLATPQGMAFGVAIAAAVLGLRLLLNRRAPRASAPDAGRRGSRDPG